MQKEIRKESPEQKEHRNMMEGQQYLQEEIDRISKNYEMGHKSFLDVISKDKIPDGFEYFWGRESVKGIPDNARINELTRKGWKPVPPERHPELFVDNILGREDAFRGYIYNNGLILFQRPICFGEREREYVNRYNASILRDMPSVEGFMGQSGIPAKFISDPGGFTNRGEVGF